MDAKEKAKEQRMANIQRRFKTVQDRQLHQAQLQKALRSPKVWVVAFLVFAVTLTLLLARG